MIFQPIARPVRARAPRRDPQDALCRALLAAAGGDARIALVVGRPWASATFTGRRFRVTLRIEGADAGTRAADAAARLPEHEFRIARQIVADVAIDARRDDWDGRGAELDLAILMVEDW